MWLKKKTYFAIFVSNELIFDIHVKSTLRKIIFVRK